MSAETQPVPLRVVPPPLVSNAPGVNAPKGTKDKEGLLGPLTMRERAMVCAIWNALAAFQYNAEGGDMNHGERQGLLGLLVAFKDATGCAWTDAVWS